MFTQAINTVNSLQFKSPNYVRKAIKQVKKTYSGYVQLKQAENISRYFAEFFNPIIDNSQSSLDASSKIRHEVFCEELALFNKTKNGKETDNYDSFSKHCLIQHTNSKAYAGTLRLIEPKDKNHVLPIIKVAGKHITRQDLHPSNFPIEETLEISRISIPKAFRRRNIDKFKGAAQAGVNTDTYNYSEMELRCFPLIAVGLYMACAAYSGISKRQHVYFMVEPRLAKSMRHIGMKLEQIGDEFEYVGTRAPYYINYHDFVKNLKPSFKVMMKAFYKILKPQQDNKSHTISLH
jgi:N-acyl amino acid synthase of PEP-CTERM/exosortase system